MNDRNLRLQVVMSAIDKLTRPFKQARASTQELAASVKQSRDALNQLNQTTAKLDGFKKLQAENQKLGERLNYARQKANLMNQELGASGPPSQRQILALEKQRLAVQRLEERQGKLQTRTAQVRAELYRAGISANDGASATARITRETERYNRQLSVNEARLKRAGEQQGKLAAARSSFEKTKALRNEIAGTGAGMVATGVATAMPLLAPVKAYSESEDAATQLAASMMGPGAKILPEFEQINRLALQLGDRLPGTTADFQNMMTMLRRQGMSATAILGGLGEATAYLGVQLKMPATEAAEFAAKLQDATGTAEKDMMGLMDVIQKGFYAGVDPNNMLNGYAKISSAMSILKVRGLDAAKAMAPLLVMADQAGMAGESAGNAYRKIFQASMNRDKVTGANDDLKAAGYKVKLSFSDGKGEFAGLDNLYKQLSKIKGLSTEMKLSTLKGIFGDDAETLQVLNIMIEKGIDGYREAGDKLQAQASLRERVDSQLKTLGNRWEAATGSFTNSLAAIGGTVAPQIKQLADWLGVGANKLGEFVQKHPQFTAVMFKTTAMFAAVTAILGALAIAIAGVIGPFAILKLSLSTIGIKIPFLTNGLSLLSSSLKMAGNAVLWLGRAAMANPILAILTLIALAGIYIWQNWETLGPKISALWDGITATVGAALSGIRTWMATKWNEIVSDVEALPGRFQAAGTALIDGLMNGISEKWDSLKSKLSSVTDLIPDWLKPDSKAPAISLNKITPASDLQSAYPRLYDSGGYIPRGQLGIVGENGPELVNGPANITSRRRTAALAGATALAFGSLTTPVAAKPLHPFSLPIQEYRDIAQPDYQNGGATGTAAQPSAVINIYPTPAQSPADIAREVARQLDELNRKAAAKSRSSFKDQGGYDS
ncbi:phage tail tape measure protein [Citrobacter portucalensis]|nr:phage tail tape measure protein [Citrobacter portucalensis]MDN4386569.1 phage tail tape measure protein [Citrobacter portucalensis]MDN4405988.1 phage tail tape measure protein [Citrobacter portucalensis]MDN4445531.1 phage tail tape measure protein [Citrobacter portucalensis]